MSQDISLIRKELENHVEIKLPYEIPHRCHIKYITHHKKKNAELFFKGGEFLSYGNNTIRIKNKARTWSVPIHTFNKDGSVQYSTHFYILNDSNKNCEEICDEKYKELQHVIQFQQETIEKLTTNLGTLELEKSYLLDEKQNYEELLEKSRHNLKDSSISNREKEKKIKQYEEVIERLTNSHPFFHKNQGNG